MLFKKLVPGYHGFHDVYKKKYVIRSFKTLVCFQFFHIVRKVFIKFYLVFLLSVACLFYTCKLFIHTFLV